MLLSSLLFISSSSPSLRSCSLIFLPHYFLLGYFGFYVFTDWWATTTINTTTTTSSASKRPRGPPR